MTTIESFIKRLNKLGIQIELKGNYPWVYLDKVNGKQVQEQYMGNHGFTVFFKAIRVGEKDKLTNISVIFKKIRELI